MNPIAIAALAASALVPPQPAPFEMINLRMAVDSCAFDPASVRVSMSGNVFRVTQHLNNCFAAGTPQVYDVRLGAVPGGDYRVEVFATTDATSAPSEALSIQVRDVPEPASPVANARPLADYTGLWYDVRESGWGLSLFQGVRNNLFGLLFVYDGGKQPDWYSLQAGTWTSPTAWRGTVFRTDGPSFFADSFDPGLVHYTSVGDATLDFTQVPGEERTVRFSYTVDGVTVTKTIQRMRF